jgi:hypothetical protein
MISNSTENKHAFMSIGVQKKWGRKYFLDKADTSYGRFYRLYNEIMHVIYPKADDFNIPVLYPVVEDIDIAY